MLTYVLVSVAVVVVIIIFRHGSETDEVVELAEWEANPTQDLRRPLSKAFARF